MKRSGSLLALAVAIVLSSSTAFAQAAPDVTLTRLDCGTPQAPTDVNARFSDTYAYPGVKLQFVFSCYLIKHGDDYMVWDTGQATSAGAVAPKVGLVDLLAQLKVSPEQVKYIGISHFHGDHIGQANALPKATLLIGKGDWDVLTAPSHRPTPIRSWSPTGLAAEGPSKPCRWTRMCSAMVAWSCWRPPDTRQGITASSSSWRRRAR